MSDPQDPYYQWLGIPPGDRPPDAYQILGIERFEANPEVIRSAAQRQMGHLRTFGLGRDSALSQQLLNEVAAAQSRLLDARKKAAYDRDLAEKLAALGRASDLNRSRAAVTSIQLGPAPRSGRRLRRRILWLAVAAGLVVLMALAVSAGVSLWDAMFEKTVGSPAPPIEAPPPRVQPPPEPTRPPKPPVIIETQNSRGRP